MGVLPSTKYRNNERTVSGNVMVSNSDVLLNVDTSSIACTINLQEIPADYWSTLYTLYIKDLSGNCATNNITIVAPTGFKINNQQSIILNQNSISAYVVVSSNLDYSASFVSPSIISVPITVKNTAYVMKNGNDSTGLVERFDAPFLTINAAISALDTYYSTRTENERCQVIVEDGYYEEDINLKQYIDLYLGNSIINGCISDNNVSFESISDGLWHNIIYGSSKIERTNYGGAFGQAIIINKSNNNILINCDLISNSINDTIAITGGYCKIICNNIQAKSTLQAFHNAINMAASEGESRCILEVFGANIDTYLGGLSPTIDFATTVSQTLILNNCQVRTKIDNGEIACNSAITSGRTSLSQNGILKLYNTTIYSQNGSSIEVFTGCNLSVYYIHSNIANTPTLENGTLNTYINTLQIDPTLPY
jgi:hypothetical protein